ncbi:hypothetical protein Efla_001976 [Eimeria flavescens]
MHACEAARGEARQADEAVLPTELLRDEEYDEQRVPGWTQKICENCIRRLVDLKKPYKFVVHVVLAQRGAGSLHLTSSNHWCVGADGVVTCVWPEERLHEQVTLGVKAAVQVFGFAI